MSFPRYERYKDSGVEWLGDVPAHWAIKRLKHVCRVTPSNVDKKSYDDELPIRLCNYTDVYYNELITADQDFMAATASHDQVEKFSLKAGQTIITKDSETADDIAIAAYVPEDLPGVVCGYHLSIVEPKPGTAGAFIKWFFGSRYAKASFAVRANGLTRVGLSQYALDNVELPFASFSEQVAIAAFLDRETAKIDALVKEQQRLIELLKEKRQAVISHAVTKGLDTNAPMKDSLAEWLGMVPEHWGVGALTRIAERVVVGIAEAAVHAYVDDGVPILRSANVRAGKIIGELLFVDREYAAERGSKGMRAGDLITVRTGHAGVTAVIPEGFDGCQCFTMLITSLTHTSNPNYYCYWLNSAIPQHYFSIEAWGSAQPNISVPILKSVPILVPPKSEQEAIAEFLDRETAKIDALSSEIANSMLLLQERRSALISAAVTGMIDVRGPVEADAPIPNVVAA